MSGRTIFERMSAVARHGEAVTMLADAAQRAGMPVDQQLRFENFLRQLSGERPRLEPLPTPPKTAMRADPPNLPEFARRA